MKLTARRIRIPALAILASALPLVVQAQAGVKPGEETLIVRLGAVTTNFETYARIDGATNGGTGIDLEGETGLNSDKSTFIIGGTFRPFQRHRFDGFYDSVKRNASKTTERAFVIGDDVIPAGTVLSTEQETKIGYAGYRYSFLKSPDMEVAAGLGIYGGNFKFRFDAQSPVVNIDTSTTLPLPVLTLSGDFYLTDNMTITLNLRGLKVKIGDVDGSVFQAGIAAEYFLTKNFGIGAAIDRLDIEADVTKNSFRGNAEVKSTAGRLFLTARF